MKKLLFATLLLLAVPAVAQTCSPFQGLGTTQFFDNSGNVLTNGVLYSFQASTSTQQATFTDSTCTVSNVNPITFTTGARVNIWLTTGSNYKFVLCVQNDGSTCAASDVLFSVDNVPGGVSGGGGGGGAPFISTSANPATTGVLRCASGDVCFAFRNAANSGNLGFTKDVNDVFSFPTAFKMAAVGTPSGLAAGFSHLWNDNTANRWKVSNNGAAATQLVVSGNDISASDGVTAVHFGATQETLSSTAPTTGQYLQFNGTNIVGAAAATESTFGWTNQTTTLTSVNCVTNPGQSFCAQTVFALAHTLTRLTYSIGAGPSGCGTNAVISVRDVTSSTNLATSTVTGATGAFVDSGALSVAMTAGHTFLIGVTTVASGCGTSPIVNTATMVFQ